MLQKLGKLDLVPRAIQKSKSLIRHEDLGYKGAFLTQLRQTFNQKNSHLLDQENQEQVLKRIYEEMNELYIEEHWKLLQGDLMEQTFNIFKALYEVTRTKELIFDSRYASYSKSKELLDPDKFPILRIMEPKFIEYVSIWEYDPSLLLKVQKEVGYSLQVKESSLEHPCKIKNYPCLVSGNGVFLNCKKGSILPGTLLGFVPGVVSKGDVMNESYLVDGGVIKRYDGFWIDYNAILPYPYRTGLSFQEYVEELEEGLKMNVYQKDDSIYAKGQFINPYALGHLINHPRPDTHANVILVDLNIPHTFFPTYFLRYLPNINDIPIKKGSEFHEDCIRALGIVAIDTIGNGEELFVDYLKDDRYRMENAPDWLIQPNPPPLIEYLTKKQYEFEPPKIIKLLHAHKLSKLGEIYEEFEHRVLLPQNQRYPKLQQEPVKLISQIIQKNHQLLNHISHDEK